MLSLDSAVENTGDTWGYFSEKSVNGLEVSGGWCIFEQLELLGGDVPIACVRASSPISLPISREFALCDSY